MGGYQKSTLIENFPGDSNIYSYIVQFSPPYMTTGKTIALPRWTFFGKVISLLLNILSRLVIAFLPGASVF